MTRTRQTAFAIAQALRKELAQTELLELADLLEIARSINPLGRPPRPFVNIDRSSVTPKVDSALSDLITQPPELLCEVERSCRKAPTLRVLSLKTTTIQAALQAGDTQYELQKLLGEGGQGLVFAAQENPPNRQVAIKLGFQTDLGLTESAVSGKLNHPAIVSVFRSGVLDMRWDTLPDEIRERFRRKAIASSVDKQLPSTSQLPHGRMSFFTMPLVEGESLQSHLSRTSAPLASHTACQWMARICRGVAYAHSQNVIHRDLKPANILLDQNELPHICDFGIANSSGCTWLYAAPEQHDRANTADHRSDIYSLGLLTLELLLGRSPLLNADENPSTLTSDLLLERKLELPTSLSELLKSFDPDVVAVIAKCLKVFRRDRYQSADALADDFDAMLAGRSVSVRQRNWLEHWQRWARNQPKYAALATIAAASLTTLAIGGPLLAYTIRGQRDELKNNLQIINQQKEELRVALTTSEAQTKLAKSNELQAKQRLAKLIETTGRDLFLAGDLLRSAPYLAAAKSMLIDSDASTAEAKRVIDARLRFIASRAPKLTHVARLNGAEGGFILPQGSQAIVIGGGLSNLYLWDLDNHTSPSSLGINADIALWPNKRWSQHFDPISKSFVGSASPDSQGIYQAVEPFDNSVLASFLPSGELLCISDDGDTSVGRIYEKSNEGAWQVSEQINLPLLVRDHDELTIADGGRVLLVKLASISLHLDGQRIDNVNQLVKRNHGYEMEKLGVVWDRNLSTATIVEGQNACDIGPAARALIRGNAQTGGAEVISRLSHEHLANIPCGRDLERIVVAPNGTTLATVNSNSTSNVTRVCLWDLFFKSAGTEVSLIEQASINLEGTTVTDLIFSSDSLHLLVLGSRSIPAVSQNFAQVFFTTSGAPITPPLPANSIAGASFGPEGRRLLIVERSGLIRIWDLACDADTQPITNNLPSNATEKSVPLNSATENGRNDQILATSTNFELVHDTDTTNGRLRLRDQGSNQTIATYAAQSVIKARISPQEKWVLITSASDSPYPFTNLFPIPLPPDNESTFANVVRSERFLFNCDADDAVYLLDETHLLLPNVNSGELLRLDEKRYVNLLEGINSWNNPDIQVDDEQRMIVVHYQQDSPSKQFVNIYPLPLTDAPHVSIETSERPKSVAMASDKSRVCLLASENEVTELREHRLSAPQPAERSFKLPGSFSQVFYIQDRLVVAESNTGFVIGPDSIPLAFASCYEQPEGQFDKRLLLAGTNLNDGTPVFPNMYPNIMKVRDVPISAGLQKPNLATFVLPPDTPNIDMTSWQNLAGFRIGGDGAASPLLDEELVASWTKSKPDNMSTVSLEGQLEWHHRFAALFQNVAHLHYAEILRLKPNDRNTLRLRLNAAADALAWQTVRQDILRLRELGEVSIAELKTLACANRYLGLESEYSSVRAEAETLGATIVDKAVMDACDARTNGDWDRFIQALTVVIDHGPEHGLYYQRGMARAELGDYPGALQDLLMELSSYNENSKVNLLQLFLDMGHLSQALNRTADSQAVYQRLLDYQPNRLEAFLANYDLIRNQAWALMLCEQSLADEVRNWVLETADPLESDPEKSKQFWSRRLLVMRGNDQLSKQYYARFQAARRDLITETSWDDPLLLASEVIFLAQADCDQNSLTSVDLSERTEEALAAIDAVLDRADLEQDENWSWHWKIRLTWIADQLTALIGNSEPKRSPELN